MTEDEKEDYIGIKSTRSRGITDQDRIEMRKKLSSGAKNKN